MERRESSFLITASSLFLQGVFKKLREEDTIGEHVKERGFFLLDLTFIRLEIIPIRRYTRDRYKFIPENIPVYVEYSIEKRTILKITSKISFKYNRIHKNR